MPINADAKNAPVIGDVVWITERRLMIDGVAKDRPAASPSIGIPYIWPALPM